MKQVLVLLILLSLLPFSFGQLNCTSTKNEGGGIIKTCYHTNGKPSTIEIWDKEKHDGNIKGLNIEGKELFHYDLRSYAGHATVYLDYFENGQVKKAEYSSMPDGGIQWYRYIHQFDETGNQTSYTDLSMPNGDRVLYFEPDTIHHHKQNKHIVKPQEITICSTPYTTHFELINETSKTVTLVLKAQKNNYIQLQDTSITLKPKQTIIANSIILAQVFLNQEEGYAVEFSNIKHKKNHFKILIAQPREVKAERTYSWHILKN